MKKSKLEMLNGHGVQASTNWFCACQNTALNGLFLNVPAIFNVFSNFGTMCLLDNLADSAICGGLIIIMNHVKFSNFKFDVALK